ncbi:MAG: hypothetical protein ABSG60_06755 [Terracidiphilus sp.]|jgi:hypothetical protein
MRSFAWWPTLIVHAVATFADLRNSRLKCTTNVAHPRHETGITNDGSNSRVLKRLYVEAGDLVFGWKQSGMCRDPELALANSVKSKMPNAPAIVIGMPIFFFLH